jgi:putative transcriptional regulator
MTDAELEAWESSRDLEAELIESVRQMVDGKTSLAYSPVIAARKASGFSQAQFAVLLGVSVRTLQGWEQGRKQPSGAARTLLAIASSNPKALLAVAQK